MKVTEVRIQLADEEHGGNEHLHAFASVVFDNLVVLHDLKIIEGPRGYFVVMPEHRITDRCPRCGTKNHLRARYCNECGMRLADDRAGVDEDGRRKLYRCIIHPIDQEGRDLIQFPVLEAYADKVRAALEDKGGGGGTFSMKVLFDSHRANGAPAPQKVRT